MSQNIALIYCNALNALNTLQCIEVANNWVDSLILSGLLSNNWPQNLISLSQSQFEISHLASFLKYVLLEMLETLSCDI